MTCRLFVLKSVFLFWFVLNKQWITHHTNVRKLRNEFTVIRLNLFMIISIFFWHLFYLALISCLHCLFYIVDHMLETKCQGKTMTCCQQSWRSLKRKQVSSDCRVFFLSAFQAAVCGCKDTICSWAQHIVRGARVGGLSDSNADCLSLAGECTQIKESFVRFQWKQKTRKLNPYWRIDLLTCSSTFFAPRYYFTKWKQFDCHFMSFRMSK